MISTFYIFRAWHKEAYDTDGKLKQNASLFKALFKAYGFRYLLQGIPLVFMVRIKIVAIIRLQVFSFIYLLQIFKGGDNLSNKTRF